jgi:hypothetical protein
MTFKNKTKRPRKIRRGGIGRISDKKWTENRRRITALTKPRTTNLRTSMRVNTQIPDLTTLQEDHSPFSKAEQERNREQIVERFTKYYKTENNEHENKPKNIQEFRELIIDPVKNKYNLDLVPKNINTHLLDDYEAVRPDLFIKEKKEKQEKQSRQSFMPEPPYTFINGKKYYDLHTDFNPHKKMISSKTKRKLGKRFGRKKWGRTKNINKAKPK